MQFKVFVDVLSEIEKTSSILKITNKLSKFLKKVSRQEIKPVAYFLLGTISPPFKKVKFNMGGKQVAKAVELAFSLKNVSKRARKAGDLAKFASEHAKDSSSLSIIQVYDFLCQIAITGGVGSQVKKIEQLSVLLKKASKKEVQFIIGIIIGRLRIGVGDKIILASLAKAFSLEKSLVEQAFQLSPDIGLIAQQVRERKLRAIVKTGHPIEMMLAQRVKKMQEVFQKLSEGFVGEEKYDGERLQIHRSGNNITFYSRRLKLVTYQFPDLFKEIKKQIRSTQYIVEGEVVAVKRGKLLPFQSLMRRKRKQDIEGYVKRVPVRFYLFDLLSLNKKSFLKVRFAERRKALERITRENYFIKLAVQYKILTPKELDRAFKVSLKHDTEGLILKSLAKNSFYVPGKRGWLWIKWKKEYAEGLQDTFDVVPVGAFYGIGKRKKVYGALLCAVYNKKSKKFDTISKVGSGFTDTQLKDQLKIFKVVKHPTNVNFKKTMTPDVWFKPTEVIEVVAGEVTRSPSHTCSEKAGKGLALRFPRFVRYRKDKKPSQSTSPEEVQKLVR